MAETDYAAFPVTGWVGERDGGGPNQVWLSQRLPNRIAHLGCIRSEAALARAETRRRRPALRAL